MTTLYLEQYLDSVQNLPADLYENLKYMRELDGKAQKNLLNLDALVKTYVGSRNLSKELKQKKYAAIKEGFTDTRSLGEKKVTLARDTYELVDKHIRKLDNDLAKFEDDIKRKLLANNNLREEEDEDSSNPQGRKRKALKDKTKKGARKSGVVEKKQRKSTNNTMDITMESGPALLEQLTGGGMGELDMPVDPNEPTYCTCHQVSYGEMVGCDNMDCPIEWFHFNCVGLTTKPKGKWFCTRCTEERKKKNSSH